MTRPQAQPTRLCTLREYATQLNLPVLDCGLASEENFAGKERFNKFYCHASPVVVRLPSIRIKVGTGFAFTEDGCVLDDFCLRLGVDAFIQRHPTAEALQQLPTNLVAPSGTLYLGGHNNYYHWLMNWLSRVSILEHSGHIQFFDSVLVGHKPTPFHLDSIASIPSLKDKLIVYADNRDTVEFNNCYWTSIYKDPLHAPSHLQWLRCCFLGTTVTPHTKKIYVTREDASGRRRVHNEAEVAMLLSAYGYTKVTLSSLTISEQAALFASATSIVAAHGAGLANLVFCSRGVNVCELQSAAKYSSMYHSLAKFAECNRYNILQCQPVGNAPTNLQDLHVELRALEAIIQKH